MSDYQMYRDRKEALKLIYKYKSVIPMQQYKTLVGQAKSGDCEGAKKGLYRVLNKRKDNKK